jgi:sulfur carrier protein ThiS
MMKSAVRIVLNGQAQEVPEGSEKYADAQHEGDRVEIVTFVDGGGRA